MNSVSRALHSCKVALIDIDGTLCNGTEVIQGAPQFVTRLRKQDIQPVFFTNNATRTPEAVVEMLNTLAIEAVPDEVCTSAQAAAHHLSEQLPRNGRVCFIGQSGLRNALAASSLDARHVRDADALFLSTALGACIGLDTDVHYRDLERFCSVVARLQAFVLTNADVRLMTEGGFRPGNGAIGAFVATATGVTPVVTGKPQASFVSYALARYGFKAEEAFIVGDNFKTDVAAGVRAGIHTVWVQSGVQYSLEETALSGADVIILPSVASLLV